MKEMEQIRSKFGQDSNNTSEARRWRAVSLLMMGYDFVAVCFSWFAVLWGRFDFRLDEIPAEYLQAYLKFILPYAVVMILLMAAFVYFSMMFVLWMKTLTGSLTYGFLIIAGFFLLLFILFVLLRKKMIINPIIKKMSSILFSESGEVETFGQGAGKRCGSRLGRSL